MAAGLVEESSALASNQGIPAPAAKVGSISGVGDGERTKDDDPRGSDESMGSPSSSAVEKDAEASGPIWDSGREGASAPKDGPLGLMHEGNGGAEVDNECLSKCDNGSVNGAVWSSGGEAIWVCDGKGRGSKKNYSRSELEALRFLGSEEQRQRWKEVYGRLGSDLAEEYDGLCLHNPKKQKRARKKKEVSKICGNAAESLEVPDMSYLAIGDNVVGDENCVVIEELCDPYENINHSFDSSEDEYDSIRKPAFFVEGEPDFDSGPPLDGLEYLRRVRWEASHIPKVKVAKLDLSKLSSEQTPYMPKIPEIAKCPQNLLPMKCWEDAFLAEFSDLRQAFARLENSEDEPTAEFFQAFSRLENLGGNRPATEIFQALARQNSDGDQPATGVSESSCEQPDPLQQPKSIPTLTLVLRMDTVARAATLRNYISMVEGKTELTRDDCLWLFALCVAVDAPLHADTCASLRCLLRKCSSLRAMKSEPDDEVAMLNLLITITGKYFGQAEKLED